MQTIPGERPLQKTSLTVSANKNRTVLLKSLGTARSQDGDEAVKHEYVSGGRSQPRTSDASPTLSKTSPRQTLVEPQYCRPTRILICKSNFNYFNKTNPFQLLFFV